MLLSGKAARFPLASVERPIRQRPTVPFASATTPLRSVYKPATYVSPDSQKTTWLQVGEGQTRLEVCTLSPAKKKLYRKARNKAPSTPDSFTQMMNAEIAADLLATTSIRQDLDAMFVKKEEQKQEQQEAVRSKNAVFGVAQSAGVCRRMEDRHRVLPVLTMDEAAGPNPLTTDCSYAAVFDGHYGSRAAELASTRMHYHLAKTEELQSILGASSRPESTGCQSAVSSALKQSFQHMEQELLDEFRENPGKMVSGTTALVALRMGRDLYTANAGDCRAVLCRRGAAVPLTHDHKPSDEAERARIEELGGTLEFQRGWRVVVDERDGHPKRGITVSRTLGDLHFKEPLPLLASEPDVQHTQLGPDDSFLILGSDGLWGAINNNMAVEVVAKSLREQRGSADKQEAATQAAKRLMYRALDRGSMDNVTVVVMVLDWDV